MAYVFNNFAYGSLAEDILAGDTQVKIDPNRNLPESGKFMLVIWDIDVFPNPADDPNTEIVEAEYTGADDIYDIVRGQESTIAVEHFTGNEAALHMTAGVLEAERLTLGTATGLTLSDGELSISVGYSIPQDTEISNWDTAYNWGDHSLAGYLTFETDPIFAASDVAGVTSTDITNWNTAYGWGDHAGLYDPAGTASSEVNDHESTYDHDWYDTSFEGLNEPTGFENITDSVLSFVDGTRTFTITPVVSFSYYNKGIKYTKSSSENIVISDVEGIHVIYYDGETLSETASPDYGDLIVNYPTVSYIYWDAVNSTAITISDERHGPIMDGRTHQYLHLTRGTQWVSGLAIGDISADGDGDSDVSATVSVDGGTIEDEDLSHTFSDDSPQDLSPIAKIPVFYLDGLNWRKDVATNFPVKSFVGGDGRLAYNNSGGQTEVPNLDFVLTHIFATNDIAEPVIAIQGQSYYTTLGNARDGATTEISTLQTIGLPIEEFVVIGTIIYQTGNPYDNQVKARIRSTDAGEDYVDWRLARLNIVIGAATSHSLLSNLDFANSGHTGFEPTVTKGDLTAGSTKISIGGTGIGAVIGAGASVDVVENQVDHNSLLNTHNLTTDIIHNSLGGLQGGTTDEYYHLTETEHGYVPITYDHSQLTSGNPHQVTPTELGLVIGTDIQAWDDDLDDIAALTPTDSNFIVGGGSTWVTESGADARVSIGMADAFDGIIFDCGTSDISLDTDYSFDGGYSL